MKKIHIVKTSLMSVSVLSLSLVWVSAPIFAQGNSNQPELQQTVEIQQGSGQEQAELRQQQAQARQQTRRETRCSQIQQRLEQHLTNLETRAETRENRYQRIITKLNNIAARLENNEIDTTELYAAIAELSRLVSSYESSYQQYISEVKNAVNVSCSGDEQLRNVLGEARSSVATAKQGAQEIKEYIQNSVKPILLDIKTQLRATQAQTGELESAGN